MTIHIGAEPGAIAETILLPGDPLRAQYLAETYLDDPVCYNRVRGMLGFTGSYRGKRVSVQGTGMGIPSISIYVHELINDFGVKNLIRIGTCGALQPQMKLRDVVLAMTASTNSHTNRLRFGGQDFAPSASFRLLKRAYEAAEAKGFPVHVGGVFTSDSFYDDLEAWKRYAAHGVLAVEMETTGLYTLAAKFGVEALTILTVSDSLVSRVEDSSEVRERSYTQMMEVALELAS